MRDPHVFPFIFPVAGQEAKVIHISKVLGLRVGKMRKELNSLGLEKFFRAFEVRGAELRG